MVLIGIMYCDDIGMRKPGNEPGLQVEAFNKIAISGKPGRENLQLLPGQGSPGALCRHEPSPPGQRGPGSCSFQASHRSDRLVARNCRGEDAMPVLRPLSSSSRGTIDRAPTAECLAPGEYQYGLAKLDFISLLQRVGLVFIH